MIAPRISRPASQLLSRFRPLITTSRPAIRFAAPIIHLTRRGYATPSNVKEVAVRDALNEALAEELESNAKVFVLGEEVAQYNGA